MYLWTDINQNTITDQQRAELYMRLFSYCSEDFVNNQDLMQFTTNLVAWAQSIEERLTILGNNLVTHTHIIPPHTHPILPHTHATSMGPTDGGTLFITQPSTAYQAEQTTVDLSWKTATVPANYFNTSGSITNMNNKVTVGTGLIGDSTPSPRRATPEPKALTPNIPPYLVPNPV